MNHIINKNNDRFDNIKKILNKTENIGRLTLLELNSQGEQIKNMTQKSNILYDQLKITKTKLNKIISTISFPNLFDKDNILEEQNYNSNTSQLYLNDNFIQDFSNKNKDEKYLIHNDIDDLSLKLKRLKSIAIEMNTEIKEQNIHITNLSKNIDKITNVMDINNSNLNKTIMEE